MYKSRLEKIHLSYPSGNKINDRKKNQSGIVALDFIFATVLVFSFFTIFFALSYTLSIISVAQYIGYSSSRAYYSANKSPDEQQQAGKAKFAQLMNQPVFKKLFDKKWFTFQNPEFQDFASLYTNNTPDPRDLAEGFRGQFVAKLLEIKTPFFGNTFESPDSFSANITSFLGREPTSDECLNFYSQRFNKILSNTGKEKQIYSTAPVPTAKTQLFFVDNGC